MKKLQKLSSSKITNAKLGLKSFEKLLTDSDEVDEKAIRKVFYDNPDLSSYLNTFNYGGHRGNRWAKEFDLAGSFAVDYISGHFDQKCYNFVEFEGAEKNSIFNQKQRSTPYWGQKYNDGFNQIIDWFWKLQTHKYDTSFTSEFGSGEIMFSGILIIGRNKFIKGEDLARFRFRNSKFIVDSHQIRILTYDDLYNSLDDKIENGS